MAAGRRRAQLELAELSAFPVPGVSRFEVDATDPMVWTFECSGGAAVKVTLPAQYPFEPPQVQLVAPTELAAAWRHQDIGRLLPSTTEWSPGNSVQGAVRELLVLLPDIGRGHLSLPPRPISAVGPEPEPEPESESESELEREFKPDPEVEPELCGWEAVEAEVAALRASPAVAGLKVEELGSLRLQPPAGDSVGGESGGAEVELVIVGPSGSAYAAGRYRLRLYWATPTAGVAGLVFLSQIHHAYFIGGAAGRKPLPAFFDLLQAGSTRKIRGSGTTKSAARGPGQAGQVGLKAFLRLFSRIMSGAQRLGPDLTADAASNSTGGGGPSFTQLARVEADRQTAMVDYMPMRKEQQLFSRLQDGKCTWLPEWTAEPLRSALSGEAGGRSPDALRAVVDEEVPGLYSVDLFTPEACGLLLRECDAYQASGLPVNRPNSMNNYGVVVNDIGMEPLLDSLQAAVLQPLCAALYPGSKVTRRLDAHHSFLVEYEQGHDLGLDMHTDDSDVTVNVCLGREFTGAGLTFCGGVGTPEHRKQRHRYNHAVGRAVIHLGTVRHGADDIETGARANLIIWNINTDFRRTAAYNRRNQLAPPHYAQENGPPDPVCVSFTHDVDFEQYGEVPAGRSLGEFRWCPPPHARHA